MSRVAGISMVLRCTSKRAPGPPGRPDRAVPRAIPDQRVPLVPQVPRVRKAQLEPKARRACQGYRGPWANADRSVRPETKATPDCLARRALPVRRDPREKQVLLARLAWGQPDRRARLC